MKVPAPFFALLLIVASCAAGDAKAPEAKKPAKHLAPLVFVPNGGPWKGETPFQGASCTTLDTDAKAVFGLMARAGLGDEFPVQDKKGTILFEVRLENGTADHLSLVISSEEGEQKVRVPIDKGAEFSVRGEKYRVDFPTQTVEAGPGERPSTNKAMILIKRKP